MNAAPDNNAHPQEAARERDHHNRVIAFLDRIAEIRIFAALRATSGDNPSEASVAFVINHPQEPDIPGESNAPQGRMNTNNHANLFPGDPVHDPGIQFEEGNEFPTLFPTGTADPQAQRIPLRNRNLGPRNHPRPPRE